MVSLEKLLASSFSAGQMGVGGGEKAKAGWGRQKQGGLAGPDTLMEEESKVPSERSDAWGKKESIKVDLNTQASKP